MTDDERLPDPSSIIPELPVGSAVIVRSRSSEARMQKAQGLWSLCRHHRVSLLVSSEKPPTQLIGDGVHVPESGRRNWCRKEFMRQQPGLVTTSAHDLTSAQRAVAWGTDAVLLSPILPTQSHPGGRSLGWWRGAAISNQLTVPVIALGGIDYTTVVRARNLGFFGWAGISMFVAPARQF